MPYCTSYFKILGCPRAKQGLCHYDTWGGDPSLIRYSSKTAEQIFMKLSGIVHYMMPYCTFYFKFLFEWFWGFPEQNKDFAIQNMRERGNHFVSIAHSISSFPYFFFFIIYRSRRIIFLTVIFKCICTSMYIDLNEIHFFLWNKYFIIDNR